MTPWLPEFLRSPVAALIGEPCTGLGLGIVLGGCIVKLPQLFKILKSKSVAGISLSSYLLEVLANAITLAYSFRKGYSFTFTTYGEALFIGAQNIVITLLILAFTERAAQGVATNVLLLIFTYAMFTPSMVGGALLSMLYGLTIPLVISSRFP
ncbi:hypothetical protein LPJ55_005943 [Coemansia sp. RSA 990]|nr:hypothetical protein LPJ68_005957 [Coemansia sp. RSA 1086]KAJ1867567.1 hypothetical protein LPJ55_005943 [Coemansia sp. RSA 990]KAJ2668767.1 hypothetical protein IWW42_004972 [Coemansia sp. RSA 1085]